MVKYNKEIILKIRKNKKAMNDQKWTDIINKIEGMYDIIEQAEEELDNNSYYQFCVFQTPMGKLKIERQKKPKIIDKQTQYSNRVGSSVNVNIVYSEDEFVDTIKLFQEKDNEWEEIDAKAIL